MQNLDRKTVQLKYFKFLHIAIAIALTGFVVRYPLEYKINDYNAFLIPPLILFYFLPWLYKKTDNLNLTCGLLIILSCFVASCIIFVAGGFDAPGIFWLAFVPLMSGILLGEKGTIGGIGISLIILLVFYILNQMGINPNIVRALDLYKSEKLINTIIFFIFTSGVTFHLIRTQNKIRSEYENQNIKVATLLRILLHDIANPITILRFRASQLVKKLAGDEAKQVEVIQKKVDEILSIMEHSRTLYLMGSQKGKMELETVNLVDVLVEAIDNANEYGKEKKCRIMFSHLVKEANVNGFAVILKNEIFTNILTNAIKFSESLGKIEVTLDEQDIYYRIKIADHGIGMNSELQSKIFSFDEQTSREGTAGEKGTGFGLPIVKELVEQFNGKISLESIEKTADNGKHGTSVTVMLPKAQS
jgi:signal transduction histidine kinase